jgi:hypothetical protein
MGRSCAEAEKALVSRRLSGVGRTAAWCWAGFLAGVAAGFLGTPGFGFLGVVEEAGVAEVEVCAGAPDVRASVRHTAQPRLNFAAALQLISIY